MGAGRRTETFNYNGHTPGLGGGPVKVAQQRKLAERSKLGSVIFGCTSSTYNECVTNKLFGLPYSHHTYVDHIDPGMPLFLFNYVDRKMHGIFEAVSEGALNINPYAWTGSDSGARTQYPAQVRVQLRSDFTRIVSVPEVTFREIITDNYYSPTHFVFELDHEQTERLIRMFERVAGNSSRQVPLASKCSTSTSNSWQTVTSNKFWKKSEIDEKMKQKKPATVVMSEWGKGAQYNPSSSKEANLEDGYHQSLWSSKSSRDDECESDVSEDASQARGKVVERTIEPAKQRHLDVKVEKAESVQGINVKSNWYSASPIAKVEKLVDYAAQLKGNNGRGAKVADLEPSTSNKSQKSRAVEEDGLTEVQRNEMQRVLERLKDMTVVGDEPERVQAKLQQVSPVEDKECVPSDARQSSPEWERLEMERCDEEQAILKEERDLIEVTLRSLDTAVALTVSKNLELYASAIAQIRQDGMDLRRLLDEARAQRDEFQQMKSTVAGYENSQISMAAEIKALRERVAHIHGQEGESVAQKSVHCLHQIASNASERSYSPNCQSLPDIYLIGGLGDQLSRLESVMVWSPLTDTLRAAAPMLTPRCCAGASVLGEHIYVFGGGDGSSWYDTVEKYDRRADQWISCASMKIQRGSLGGVTVGDRIFAVGGGNGLVSFSEVEAFDPYLGVWLPCASMLEKRFCVAATELAGAMYALGGFDGEQYLMSVERYDPREAVWSKLPSMTVKRGSLSAAVLNGKIYALGGYDGDGILDTMEVFDPIAGRWDAGPHMWCPRAYGAAAVVGEALYYIGGLSEEEAVDPGGYVSWRSPWQASWQQYTLGSSVPGLYINSSHQIQLFMENSSWESVQHCALGKRSCLAAVVF